MARHIDQDVYFIGFDQVGGLVVSRFLISRQWSNADFSRAVT